MDLEQRIAEIELRNKRVELDKARETSTLRMLLVAWLTYLCIVLFFWVADLPQPRINALVPALGFLLSTLSLPYVKRWRIAKKLWS